MTIGVVRMARQARASGTNALDHIRIQPAQNGGFNVQHYGSDPLTAPQNYSFGANEGQAMLNHVGKALKVRPPAAPKPGKIPGKEV